MYVYLNMTEKAHLGTKEAFCSSCNSCGAIALLAKGLLAIVYMPATFVLGHHEARAG